MNEPLVASDAVEEVKAVAPKVAKKVLSGMTDWFDDPEPIIRSDHPEDLAKLHPELQAFVREGPMGQSLMHPLHYQVFGGIIWKQANATFEYKTKAVKEALERRDIYKVCMLHERPWRLTALETMWKEGTINVHELRETLPHMWTDTENPRQFGRTPLRLFRAAGFVHDRRTDPDDYESPALDNEKVLPELPPILTIYRGTGYGEDPGLAWSTDKGVASWFARRFREENPAHRLSRVPGVGEPLLLLGTVRKADVLGWFTGRGEHEVVVDPRKVRNQRPIALVPLKKAKAEIDL